MTLPKRYVVWDLETTGFNPITGKILEIACLVIDDGKEVGAYSTLFNHQVEIPDEAFAVHGISAEMCAMEGKHPDVALAEVMNLFTGAEAHVTHNGIKFDIPFLVEAINQSVGLKDTDTAEIIDFLKNKAIDTAVYVKANKLGLNQSWAEDFNEFANRVMNIRAFGVKYNLGLTCDEMGIDRSQVTQHRAGADVFLTNEVFKRLYAEL